MARVSERRNRNRTRPKAAIRLFVVATPQYIGLGFSSACRMRSSRSSAVTQFLEAFSSSSSRAVLRRCATKSRCARTTAFRRSAVSLARAELDAFRRERDQNEFPIESCHRASHDAWVAFRGADFFSNEKETKEDADGVNGSFVVSVAEGSSATLLEASARADACLRQAAYF